MRSTLTNDELNGLLLTTESANLKDEDLDQAEQDWKYYDNSESTVTFEWTICHAITKANYQQLHKLSKGYPAHVRIYVELILLENAGKTKEVMENANAWR